MTGGGHGGQAAQPCLFMLFHVGRRPTAPDVRATLARGSCGQVSYDPAGGDGVGVPGDWLEVVLDGLTFDVLGLAPGRSLQPSIPRHLFGLPAAALTGCEAIGLAPGPHIASAASAPPVVRTLLRLAAGLASQLEGVVAMQWLPAASVMQKDRFVDIVGDWLAGGPFPALGLTGVVEQPGPQIASDGLAFFTGRELVLDPALSTDRVAATRLITRLIDRLVNEPRFEGEEKVLLDDGTCLRLSAAKAVITVSPG